MSRRPDFLHRRRNFDARGTFYVVFLSSDCFNKKKTKNILDFLNLITSRAYTFKAALSFMKVDRITHLFEIFEDSVRSPLEFGSAGSRPHFLFIFNSDYDSIWLSFRDMGGIDIHQTTDERLHCLSPTCYYRLAT